MSEEMDYKKYAVLYVDDEEKSLKSFSLRCSADQFRILTAPNAKEGAASCWKRTRMKSDW